MNFTQEDINANYWKPGPGSAPKTPPPPPATFSSGGGSSGPAANTTPDSGVGSSDPDQPKKKVILRSGAFSPGPDGYAFTKTVKVKCEASEEGCKVGEKVSGLVNFALFTRYKGAEMNHQHSADSGVHDGIADAELTLYYDEGYYNDGLPEDQTVEYFFKATHQRGSSELVSEVLKMPQAPAQDLKKGMFDDKACAKYPNSRKKDADGYVSGTSIFDLQTNLKNLGFVEIGNPDGDFGDKTDKAVRAFQDAAREKARKDKASGNAVQVEATFTSATDGVVGEKTQDEIKLWLDKGYLRPDPVLRHGHYDDDGSTNGKGEKGGKDHQPGKPVVEAQNDLKKVAAYAGAVDGWFFDKMKDAVKLFQEWAVKGVFLIDGKETDIGEKLTGHKEGEVDGPTKAMMKKVVEKGGKVPSGGKSVKKGDKGTVVEEINIRLAGFGGGVPSDTFDDLTETKVKNFQRDYMKMKEPTGVVDADTAKAVDDFESKYPIDFSQLKCDCSKKCGGFGKGRHRNEYTVQTTPPMELYNKYEYPGVHRALLWAVRGIMFFLESENMKVQKFSSGYRCHDNNAEHKNSAGKPRTSTNHMGKAVDFHIATKNQLGQWHRSNSADENKSTCDKVRAICTKRINAQTRWNDLNRFALEPSNAIKEGEAIATDWVHLDLRTFKGSYLEDRFFCKDTSGLDGQKLSTALTAS